MYQGKDGALYERCDICGMKTEVDDAQDATGWGINHMDMFHRPDCECHDFGHPIHNCRTHNIRNCTICLHTPQAVL